MHVTRPSFMVIVVVRRVELICTCILARMLDSELFVSRTAILSLYP